MLFENQRVVVMGLGRFGGGVGAARYLSGQGARVLVTDRDDAATLHDSLAQLADDLTIEYRLGEHRVADFVQADLVVSNPGIKPVGNVYLDAARAAGVPIVTEIQLVTRRLNRQRVIGITGTAGKSTVTAMVGHVMKQCCPGSKIWIGGNLGGSLLGHVDEIDKNRDWVVLELSSFMLHYLRADGWSPCIAVLTNLSPNHLDWHETVENYAEDKRGIFAFQDDRSGDVMIDGTTLGGAPPVIELLMPGVHNQANANLAAMAIHAAVGITHEQCWDALRDFSGLPHRLQWVCEHEEVRYYNDSKSTTPESAMLAIDAFDRGRVHAILGGYDKGSDLTAMAKHAAKHCRAVYCIGQTGDAIAAAARGVAGLQGKSGGGGGVVRCERVEDAVMATMGRRHRGDVVVLSPGCASWDQFTNYEARGAAFVGAVLRATSEGCAVPKKS